MAGRCQWSVVGGRRVFAWRRFADFGASHFLFVEVRVQATYLSSLTLSVLGCGDIGRCIAAAAQAFGMRTIGYTRTPRGENDKRQRGVDEYTTDLSHALQSADYVVAALPSTPETRRLLSGEALAIASKDKGGKCPVFLNVGRGDVIDEVSIVSALDNQYISAAILDVFEVEPLPVESPLWSHAKVVVSPHVSG